jgi:FMN phosphatase YigB (HAD superfamily)
VKRIVVFDLDNTLIDSAHRTPNNPDGTLNLQRYFALKSRETIFLDSLLPLVRVYSSLKNSNNYLIACTARAMNQDDYDFLEEYSLTFNAIYCRPLDGSEHHIKDAVLKRRKIARLKTLKQFRGLPIYMFDDAPPVISEMRKIGIVCLNAEKINEKIQPSN